jgi:hypothetical protein
MASKRPLGFSSTVFRKKFRAGMTVRNYRDNEVVFSQGDSSDLWRDYVEQFDFCRPERGVVSLCSY